MVTADDIKRSFSDKPVKYIWDLLSEIYDPEVPVLSIIDLGIVREINHVSEAGEGKWLITITPTYSGCPAMDVISMNIRLKLLEAGIKNFTIVSKLSPAWTTDWMTEAGKQKLQAYGIAPPGKRNEGALFEETQVQCPRCRSMNTRMIGEFGSTACKALYQCNDCKEPFDHFKCH